MTETLAPSWSWQAAPSRDAGPGFEVYDPEFEAVLGSAARLVLVAETDAHEGPVYVPGEDALYFTTVPQAAGALEAGEPRAAIRRLALDGCSFPADLRRTKDDFDPTTERARATWMAANVTQLTHG